MKEIISFWISIYWQDCAYLVTNFFGFIIIAVYSWQMGKETTNQDVFDDQGLYGFSKNEGEMVK